MIAFPSLPIAGPIGAIVGGIAVLAWRVQETRSPVSLARIVLPPLGMSTGFCMFLLPAMRIPWTWAAAAFLLGSLVLAWPLARTSTLQRQGELVLLRRSNAFLVVILGLLALRLALRAYVDQFLTPERTAAIFFVLAFGMILRWRAGMFVQYRRLVGDGASAAEERVAA